MKTKLLSVLLALVLVLGLAAPAFAAEQTRITSGDWSYKIVDGEACLCDYLGTSTDVVVPAEIDGLKVTALGDHPEDLPFTDILLTSITMPEGLKSLCLSCFAGQTGLTEVVIPDTVTTISSYCFSSCSNLTSVKLPAGLTEIALHAFQNTGLTSIEFPEGLEYIGQGAFQNCLGLTEVTLPGSLLQVMYKAFYGCTNLEKVTAVSGVKTIGSYAFQDCTALAEVILNDGLKTIDDYAFFNTGLTSIFIPASVTAIGEFAVGFVGTTDEIDRLKDFVIHGYADTEAERYANKRYFTFVPEGQYVPIEGKCGDDAYWAFDPNTGKLRIYGYGLVDSYKAGEQPWYGLNAQITSVEVTGVYNVCGQAFYQDFPSLRELTVNSEDCYLGVHSFAYTENLKSVTLSEGVSLSYGCFEGSGLETITLPDSLDHIAQAAFKDCKQLREVKMGDNVTEIISNAFYGCTSLKQIDLSDSLWIIDFQAFAHSGLERVELPDTVGYLNGYTFSGCEDLTYVKLPAGLTEAGFNDFSDCPSLTTVTMPEGGNPSFGQWFFMNCDALTDISFHTAPTIGWNMYQNCDGLTNVVIPDGVTEIQNYAFANCLNLSYVSIPESVSAIGQNAFSACGRLKAVAFRGDAPAFAENVFAADALKCYYPAGNDTWTDEVMQQYGGTVTWIPYEPLPFTDVAVNAFFYDSVAWAVENGITNGLSDTVFGPGAVCNRAQVVTFLWRAAGSPEPTVMEHSFVDVAEGSFYEKAVLWAVEKGITTGTDATHFSPAAPCNRATVVTFLWRARGCPAPAAHSSPFTDVTDNSWYADAVMWAVEKGITNGLSAAEFGPATSCNRAQVVTFLYRAYADNVE